MAKYTAKQLHALPDNARLEDREGTVWQPYFWKGERTKGWLDRDHGPGNHMSIDTQYLPAYLLAQRDLTLVQDALRGATTKEN